MLAVSMKLMPCSNARSMHALAWLSSTPRPYVSHDPREISEMLRLLVPSWRYRMPSLFLESRKKIARLDAGALHFYVTALSIPLDRQNETFPEMGRLYRWRLCPPDSDRRWHRLRHHVIANVENVPDRGRDSPDSYRLRRYRTRTAPRQRSGEMRGLPRRQPRREICQRRGNLREAHCTQPHLR